MLLRPRSPREPSVLYLPASLSARCRQGDRKAPRVSSGAAVMQCSNSSCTTRYGLQPLGSHCLPGASLGTQNLLTHQSVRLLHCWQAARSTQAEPIVLTCRASAVCAGSLWSVRAACPPVQQAEQGWKHGFAGQERVDVDTGHRLVRDKHQQKEPVTPSCGKKQDRGCLTVYVGGRKPSSSTYLFRSHCPKSSA